MDLRSILKKGTEHYFGCMILSAQDMKCNSNGTEQFLGRTQEDNVSGPGKNILEEG